MFYKRTKQQKIMNIAVQQLHIMMEQHALTVNILISIN